MMLVFFIPAAIIALISRLFPDAFSWLKNIPAGVTAVLPFLAALVLAAALAVSLLVSARILRHKQY